MPQAPAAGRLLRFIYGNEQDKRSGSVITRKCVERVSEFPIVPITRRYFCRLMPGSYDHGSVNQPWIVAIVTRHDL